MEEEKFSELKPNFWIPFWIVLWAGTLAFQGIVELWHLKLKSPAYYVVQFLVLIVLFAGLNLVIKRWPLVFGWPDRQADRLNFFSFKAWDIKGLATFFALLATLSLIVTLNGGLRAIILGQGISAAIAVYLWFLLSLGESWTKRREKATFLDACLFLMLIASTLWAIISVTIWFAGRNG